MVNLETLFEKYENEYLEWEDVHPQRSLRPDIHAFLLLQHLVPGRGSMVNGAEHDRIYLDTDPEKLAKVITEEQVLELCRCGVLFEGDSLYMLS